MLYSWTLSDIISDLFNRFPMMGHACFVDVETKSTLLMLIQGKPNTLYPRFVFHFSHDIKYCIYIYLYILFEANIN